MMSQRFEERWTQFLEGEIREEGLVELQEILAADAELLHQAADLYEEHRLLGFILQPFDGDKFVSDAVSRVHVDGQQFVGDVMSQLRSPNREVTSRSLLASRFPKAQYRRVGLSVAVAMSIIAVVGAWMIVERGSNHGGESKSVANSTDATTHRAIATLLLEEECVWSSSGAFGEGKRLDAGRVELERGSAVLRFDGGAELVMVGRAVLDLQSARSVLVHFGDVVVRASDGAEGFVVTTPTSEVVDLGTEFAVKVNHAGTTEVHVLEGEVSYRQLDAPDELVKILRVGEGILIDKSGRPTALPMNSPRFKEYVWRLNPRSRTDLLTAYEGFNYSPGVLPLEQSTVGIGWSGPWRLRLKDERRKPKQDKSPNEFEIVHGQMNVSWPVPGGRLGMLKLPSGDVFYVRPLKDAIDLGSDNVTYISLMVREVKRRAHDGQPYEHLRLTLRSSEDYFGDALSFGHGPGYRPRIQAGAGNLYTSPLVFPAEQTTLWIGKIVSRPQGEDEVYFRVYGEDEKLDYAEPATWHVVSRDLQSDARLDRVLLSSTGEFGRVVDELRIGPSWRSVAPIQEVTD